MRGRRATVAALLVAAAGTTARAAPPAVLVDTFEHDLLGPGCVSDVMGVGLVVAATKDGVITRIRQPMWTTDLDGDGVPDPTWDVDGNGVLDAHDAALAGLVVVDLGATPALLTSIDGHGLDQAPQTVVYQSGAPLPLHALFAPDHTLGAMLDSGEVAIPFHAGRLYAVGAITSPGACMTRDGALTPTPPGAPAAAPALDSGTGLVAVGREMLLDRDGDGPIRGLQVDPTQIVTLIVDGQVGGEPAPPDGGGGGGGGSGGASLDSDGDLQPDAVDDCPLVADPGQLDRDHDGVGDACEPPRGGGCAAGGDTGGAALAAGLVVLAARRRRRRA